VIEPFDLPYMQRALAELALLSIPGGLLGAWIVLRRLAFYTHAVGTATFPGLVVAGPWGLPPQVAALGVSLGMAAGLERLVRGRGVAPDAATGLLLVGALGAGVVLASDVYEAGAGVDRLLFGTVLGVTSADLLLTAGAAALATLAALACHRSWTASAFDPAGARSLGVPARAADWALLAFVAVTVVVAVDAVGALLVGALLVLPAATVALLAARLPALLAGSVALTLAESVAGLWLAHALDVPPGPMVAVLAGALFALVAAAGALRRAA
jgi:ABC-type Mn2+/Zn2+ transport system permease subunit